MGLFIKRQSQNFTLFYMEKEIAIISQLYIAIQLIWNPLLLEISLSIKQSFEIFILYITLAVCLSPSKSDFFFFLCSIIKTLVKYGIDGVIYTKCIYIQFVYKWALNWKALLDSVGWTFYQEMSSTLQCFYYFIPLHAANIYISGPLHIGVTVKNRLLLWMLPLSRTYHFYLDWHPYAVSFSVHLL